MAARLRGRVSWELLLALAVQVLYLGHVLQTYFGDDDLVSRSTSGLYANLGESYWGGVHGAIDGWWTQQGRFFPESFFFGPAQYILLHDVVAYKVVLLAWTVAASVCVWLLLRELGLSRGLAALALVLATVAIQFRPQDGILAYGGLEQAVIIQVSLSLMFFHRWLRTDRRRELVWAVVLFVGASLAYEVSYIFGPLYAILALAQRRQVVATVKALVPIIVPSVVFLAIGSYGRAHAQAGSHGPYAPSFNKHELVYTFFDQAGAAFPLTYAAFDPSHLLHPFGSVVIGSLGPWDIALGLLFAAATVVLVRRLSVRDDWNPLVLVALGVGLWVLTAAPIALATRYQLELVAGLAHIPVVVEFYAFGMVAVGVAGAIARRGWPPAVAGVGVACLAVVVGSLAMLGHRANAVFIAASAPTREVSLLNEDVAATMVKDDVAPGSMLWVDPAELWNNDAYYRQFTGHKYRVKPVTPTIVPDTHEAAPPCVPGKPATWWLRAGTFAPKQSYAVLACAGGRGAHVMLRGADAGKTLMAALSPAPDRDHAPRGGVIGVVSRLRLDDLHDGVDPYATSFGPVGAPVAAEWTAGCWTLEQTPRGLGHLCEREAVLTAVNTTDRPASATLGIPIAATGDGARRVVVTGPGGVRVAKRIGEPLAVPVTVPANGTVHLRVRTEGAKVLPEAGERDAAVFVGPAVGVS